MDNLTWTQEVNDIVDEIYIGDKCPLCGADLEEGKPWMSYRHLWYENHKARSFKRRCWFCKGNHVISVRVEFYNMGTALLGECDYE